MDLFQRDLAHVGRWKTLGGASQGWIPSPFQNLPRAGSLQGAQPSKCIHLPLPPAHCAVSSHQQARTPHREGRGRGTALQQCPTAFMSWLGCQRVLGSSPGSEWPWISHALSVICGRMDGLWTGVDTMTLNVGSSSDVGPCLAGLLSLISVPSPNPVPSLSLPG